MVKTLHSPTWTLPQCNFGVHDSLPQEPSLYLH